MTIDTINRCYKEVYQSPYNYLVDQKKPRLEWFGNNFYSEKEESTPSGYSNEQMPAYVPLQIVGALKPISNMHEDVVNTVKPYKSLSYAHMKKDLLQPFRGLGNTLKGVATLLVLPFLIIYSTFAAVYYSVKILIIKLLNNSNTTFQTTPNNHILYNIERSVAWLIEGVLTTVRGITQVITFPFAWGKVIVRAFITHFIGPLKIEKNRSTKRLINLLGKTIQQEISVSSRTIAVRNKPNPYHKSIFYVRQLHNNFLRKRRSGLTSNINENLELYLFNSNIEKLNDRRMWSADKQKSVQKYLNLFRNAQDPTVPNIT